MNYPKEFENLIDAFRRLPGVGYKSAERMAYQMLEMKKEYREKFSSAINEIDHLKKCKICHNLSSSDICEICSDNERDKSVVCVVQNIKDVYAIEKSNSYKGLYHVLDGVISVKSGKLPEDLNIDSYKNTDELLEKVDFEGKDVCVLPYGGSVVPLLQD